MLMVRLRLRTKQEAADSIPSVLASLLTWLVENRARLFLAVLGRRSASLVWSRRVRLTGGHPLLRSRFKLRVALAGDGLSGQEFCPVGLTGTHRRVQTWDIFEVKELAHVARWILPV